MSVLDEKAMHAGMMEIIDQLIATYQELGAPEVVGHLRHAKRAAQDRIDRAPPGPLIVPIYP
jgi:hypothetical protein